MGASIDDIRTGAETLRSAADRPIAVQAPLPPVRADDGLDLKATMEGVAELVDAGVTSVYLNAMSVGRTPTEAGDRMAELVDAFRTVIT
jgi:dihydrodipicolinate synthase/N-acetylneuraminate lyase